MRLALNVKSTFHSSYRSWILQYAPNANERKTQTKRTNASHKLEEQRTIHEANARYTKRTHDTRTNERNETNELYGKRKRTNDTRNQRTIHERTNHWNVAIYYPMANDPGSIEVQYNIVLLLE